MQEVELGWFRDLETLQSSVNPERMFFCFLYQGSSMSLLVCPSVFSGLNLVLCVSGAIKNITADIRNTLVDLL